MIVIVFVLVIVFVFVLLLKFKYFTSSAYERKKERKKVRFLYSKIVTKKLHVRMCEWKEGRKERKEGKEGRKDLVVARFTTLSKETVSHV